MAAAESSLTRTWMGHDHARQPPGQRRQAPAKQAAVLALLAGDAKSKELPDDASVVLTHRSPHMRTHSGQIALPGGRIDPGDRDPTDCALREAWEEVGLNRREVTPLVTLPEVRIRASGYPVHPVLAYWHAPGAVGVTSPDEADAVGIVPLGALIDPRRRFTVTHGGWQGPAFWIDGYVVWGFTGSLLNALLALAGWEQPWDHERQYDLQEVLATSRNNERPIAGTSA